MKHYKVELESHDREWWRVDIAISATGLDANGRQQSFASVIDSAPKPLLEQAPARGGGKRHTTKVECEAEGKLSLHINIIPHALPEDKEHVQSDSCKAKLKVLEEGEVILNRELKVNMWGGVRLAIEL